MSSNIDITKPSDKSSSTKSIRNNFEIAKLEIENLQDNKITGGFNSSTGDLEELYSKDNTKSTKVLQMCTWNTKPPLNEYIGRVFISDIGGGSIWISNGIRWYPENGFVRLFTLQNIVSNTFNSNGIVTQYQLPIGIWQNRDKIRIQYTLGKSSGNTTATHSLRIGSNGLINDTLINGCQTTSPGGSTNLSSGVLCDIMRLDFNKIKRLGISYSGSYNGAGNSAIADDTIINNNLDTESLFLSQTITTVSPNDVFTMYDFSIDLLSGQ